MYVIQLNNGEQHYVQASTVLSSTAAPTQSAITINPTDHHLQSQNTYLQQTNQNQNLDQPIQTIHSQQHHHQQQQPQLQPQQQQPQQQQQTTVIQQQQQTDTFQDVIDYIQQLYTEIGKEMHLSQLFCLFCAQEFMDLRILLRHTTAAHRTKILDGTINLEQDFETIIRKKIEINEQQQQQQQQQQQHQQIQSPTNNSQQLYQCVQCQQMFNSLDIISEHLNHCPANVVQTTSNVAVTDVQSVGNTSSYSDMVKMEPLPSSLPAQGNNGSSNKSSNVVVQAQEPYIPYGCAQCGRRYHTIRDLMAHMRICRDETFYDAGNYLHQKNWVEAPKGQHIVINEEATNIVLKTTGLWLMPESNGSQMNSDSLRGFWVMPTSTTDYLEQQRQEQIQREQQEKLRLQQEQQRLQEQQEKLRIQQEQKRLQELEKQRREQDIQRQLLIEQQQKQLMLHQQLARQSQSTSTVVQTLTTPNAVPLIKSSPTSVISQLNQTNAIQSSRSHAQSSANTIIVLNDEQFLTAQSGGSDALRCIQASDGSYHVIGNVDLNEKTNTSNATSVIAHTSPASIEPSTTVPILTTTTRKRRGRAPKQQQQQQQNSVIYAQPNDTELVYETRDVPVMPMTKQTKRKRGGGAGITTNANEIVSTITNHTIVQNVDSPEVPAQHQQFYIAYNDNGVLVPIGPQSPIVKNDINTGGVIDLSQEQYIIEDLDASHKAQQQRNRNKTVTITENVTISPAAAISVPIHPTSTRSVQNSMTTTTMITTTTSTTNVQFAQNANDDTLAYNIDDLSHLDKPIGNEKQTTVTPIKPLKTKPEFMDSFYTFLMNREANKL